MDHAFEVRKKCPRFRILIVGRANSGKTTILRKVCDTKKEPVIYTPEGRILKHSVVAPSEQRGIHDIDNEMIFSSNPQFIFHDSRGFEAGSEEEVEKMRTFINTRAASRSIITQLHAIWYCFPMDSDRLISKADEDFFKEFGSGKVPVITIFTKFDALITKAYSALRGESICREEAKEKQEDRANVDFEMKRLLLLEGIPNGMVHQVCLRDMHENGGNCKKLMKKTADALDDKAIKLLFVSVQQNNIELSVKNAIKTVLGQHLQGDASEKLTRKLYLK